MVLRLKLRHIHCFRCRHGLQRVDEHCQENLNRPTAYFPPCLSSSRCAESQSPHSHDIQPGSSSMVLGPGNRTPIGKQDKFLFCRGALTVCRRGSEGASFVVLVIAVLHFMAIRLRERRRREVKRRGEEKEGYLQFNEISSSSPPPPPPSPSSRDTVLEEVTGDSRFLGCIKCFFEVIVKCYWRFLGKLFNLRLVGRERLSCEIIIK